MRTSLIQTSEIKILLNLRSIILVLIFVNVKTITMLTLFLQQARGRPTWSLRATWYAREPRWRPCCKCSGMEWRHWRIDLEQLCPIRGFVSPSKLLIIMSNTATTCGFILIILNSTFPMQLSLVPVYHELRAGRFPRFQWHLGAKLIYMFLVSTHGSRCSLHSKFISNCYYCVISLNVPVAYVWEWLKVS